ncbi:MAG: InlB B-repeat-containing protein, partial [Bacteroidia bacterium]|nr:InlB B-repeat-containing protein [Bacteroidia bacterium]
MTRKFTFLLMALLALTGFKSWGQENITVQIGTGAEITYNLPFNSYYGYSYNEMLIRASEINDAFQGTITSGTINSISFQAYWSNSGSTSFDFDIYMKNVDRSDYSDYSWETVSPTTDWVKAGTITSGVNDWVEFTLTEPFQWDGTKNLLIVFDADNPGHYTQTNFYYDQPGFSCGHTVYSDSYNYEPSSSYPTDGNQSVVTYRPNIKLNMDVVTATTYAINLTQPDAAVGTISATPTSAIEGATVTLSANLNPGYELDSWTVTNATTSESIDVTNNQFTMPDSDVNVSVTYNALTQHNITVVQPSDQEEVGTFTADPTQAYKDERINLSYNLKQYDDHGYKFTSWTVTKTGDPTTIVAVDHDWQDYFTMPDFDVTVSAEYEQETYYALTIIAENGDVYASPSQHITAGTMVYLNQYPDAGYDFGGWDVYYTENPDNKITVEYGQFEMPAAAVTVSATFTAKELYTVSIGTIENGTVSLIDAPVENKYYEGQQVKFNVTPDAGYMIDEVTYICDQTINIWYDSFLGYYYFTMPEAPVTINASFIMGITIHDGSYYSDNIPVYGSYTDTYNAKSQFVFPAADLTAINGSKITDLIFYTQNISWDQSFSPLTWNVFMKEVDFISPSSFTDWNEMTNVYYGTITISDYKLTLHLNTPFEYNGGNLMIGFRENDYGDFCQYTQWVGDFNNYDAYHSIATNWEQIPEQSCFLPKTTIIYEPVVKYDITLTQPATEVGTIHAFANGVEVSQASEGTEITLEHNFNLGYRFNYWTVNGEQISGNTFEMPATAVTVAVNYEALTSYDIICATIEHGEILAQYQGATITEAYEGMQIDLVANLDEGYAVTEWTVNGTPIEGSSFIMPANDVNVNATVIQRLEFTVYEDGTATNSNVPIYGLYADYYRTQSEFIIPKENLTVLKGAQITGMTFYSSNIESHNFGTPYWKVFVKEVNKTNVSIPYEDETTMTEVYLGTMNVQGNKLTVSFASPITYTGNNLMIMFDQQSNSAVFKSINWYGITTASNTALATDYDNYFGKTDNYFQFLPKTTFTYIPAPQYEVTLADVVNGTIGADPMEAAAGATIQLTATPDPHYQFGSWTTIPEVEINEDNQFIMPEGGITVSATFISLPVYEITFMANGVQDGTASYEQGATIDRVPELVPAGMTFAGWVAEDIATFIGQAPVYTTTANQAMTLYAVFSYTDENGGIVWNKVTDVTTLANNDQIIIASEADNMVLCQRVDETALTCQAEAVNIENGQIATVSDNAIIFTLEETAGNNWKLNYNDDFAGETSIATLYTQLAPIASYPAFNNEWVISGNGIQNVGDESYISYVYFSWKGELSYFATDYAAANAAQLYKRGIGSKTYYMTEVFVIDEATSLTEDMTKRNVIIADGASLNINANVTLNVAGACFNPSHDAAQLVIAEGGQLIHNNAGTVATMKKNITGTDWYTISSPLAESTEFTNVTNLIPTAVTETNYDLYRLNEANAKWINSRIYENEGDPTSVIIANPAFTTIDKGVGYIYANNAGADHIAFAGEVNVAPAECTLTNSATNGFNLIGNPFAQNIKLSDVVSQGEAELATGFYVLTNQNTWDAMIESGTIAPLQGFLVQATTAGNVTISKPTAAPSKGERSEQNINIEMIVSNSNYRDNAFAVFGEGIGLNKVNHRNAEAPMLYIPQSGENFAIAFMDENTTLFPLNFKAMTTGNYSISLKATDDINTLVLVDNMTGVETNMLLGSSYSFIGSPADKENRFTVKLGISHNDNDENEQFVYQYGNELIIDGEGTL